MTNNYIFKSVESKGAEYIVAGVIIQKCIVIKYDNDGAVVVKERRNTFDYGVYCFKNSELMFKNVKNSLATKNINTIILISLHTN